ncbi:hypothetical protein CsSME_00016947 [Camellia sinensis var. sinensis]
MSVNGETYMFGLYSGDIKSSLGYDQTTLNLISFFKDLGGNLGLISGLINEDFRFRLFSEIEWKGFIVRELIVRGLLVRGLIVRGLIARNY